jgi:hypothetical protein
MTLSAPLGTPPSRIDDHSYGTQTARRVPALMSSIGVDLSGEFLRGDVLDCCGGSVGRPRGSVGEVSGRVVLKLAAPACDMTNRDWF